MGFGLLPLRPVRPPRYRELADVDRLSEEGKKCGVGTAAAEDSDQGVAETAGRLRQVFPVLTTEIPKGE